MMTKLSLMTFASGARQLVVHEALLHAADKQDVYTNRPQIRGRPNFVLFFVFGAEKRIFFIFRPFIFRPKKMHVFSVYFIFRYKYGRKNNRKQ